MDVAAQQGRAVEALGRLGAADVNVNRADNYDGAPLANAEDEGRAAAAGERARRRLGAAYRLRRLGRAAAAARQPWGRTGLPRKGRGPAWTRPGAARDPRAFKLVT